MEDLLLIIRNCDGCTKCCDGWLAGEAHGHKFWRGRSCHFLSKKGCSIYENRPESPCKTFRCAWLLDETIPEWMKPDMSNTIITKEEENGKMFLTVYEAGSKLDSRVLSWLVLEYANGNIKNLKYQLDGGWVYLRSRDEQNTNMDVL